MNSFIQWLYGESAGEVAGGGDWRIAFISDYNNYVKFALVLVCLAMIYLAVRSYLREGEVKRGVKLAMAMLRVAVIVMVMAVILRPAIVLRHTKTLFSNVMFLMDDSLSMKFKDRYNDPKDSKKLADALHVAQPALRDYTRMDVVRKLMPQVMEKLTKDHPEDIWFFAANDDPYTRRAGATIEDGIALDPKGKPMPSSAPAHIEQMLGALTAQGYTTNIPSALRSAIDGLQGKRASIVLVSDGRMTEEGVSSRLSAVRDYASQRGISIYTVTVGDPQPPKAVGVAALSIPRDVRKNAMVNVAVKISHRGLAGQTVTLRIQGRKADQADWKDVKVTIDGKTTDSVPVKLEAPESESGGAQQGQQQVEMTIEPEDIGQYVYRAVVEYANPDDLVSEPTIAEANVNVSDKQIRVLLVSSGAGLEFQYIKSYLLSQRELYKISVWQQNADVEVNQAASSEDMKLTEFPNSLEALLKMVEGKPNGYDVIILYDPQPTEKGFDKTFIENLKTAVQKHGRGLCYIAGHKYTALSLGTMSEDYQGMRDLVPVTVSAHEVPELVGDKRPEPYPIRVTAYGLEHPVMRLGYSGESTMKAWESMPGIFWTHQLLRIKPTARVLAENSNEMRRLDRNVAEPVAAAMPVGQGRVLYMNTDETWRWRLVDDAKFYRMFWSNVIKYLTPSASRQVIITTGGDRFSAGEKINVEVEAYTEEYKELTDPTYTVTMIDKSTGDKHEIKLEAIPDKPGRYKGVIPASFTAHVGTYELTSQLIDPEKVEPKVLRIELPQAEAQRPESDPVTMETIATRSDYALDIAEAGKLADIIPPDRRPAVREDPRELWDTNMTVLLIVTLLTVEWIFRKKYNMA